MESFFSPGKLLLTSEYVVLDGALALAVPTKWGQELWSEEESDSKSRIYWEAYHQDTLWLRCEIDYATWQVVSTNNPEASLFVVSVLQSVQKASSKVLQDTRSYRLKTNLQFPSDYGLGSSSTLMTNLSNWAKINAFTLNDRALGGSGYDIAVAQEKHSLLFQIQESKRVVQPIDLDFKFKNELLFIHLNQKQNSREGIKHYRNKPISTNLVSKFTDITKKITVSQTLEEFSMLLNLHEDLLSSHLELDTARNLHFADCPTFVKSLGAWGGDFVLSAKFEGYQSYFQHKGFPTYFEWSELIN